MQLLVCPVNPEHVRAGENRGEIVFDRKQHVKSLYSNSEDAAAAAKAAAIKTPGVQYAVFGIVEIFEALKPAAPKLLRKTINEQGEIVVS